MSFRFRGVTLPMVLLSVTCGSGGPGSPTGAGQSSGVAASKKLVDLTDAEKGRLCDWMVGKAGSYGVPGTCDRSKQGLDYPFLAYDDQADCVQDSPDLTFTDCKATVAQLESCVSTLPACASLTGAASSPACSILDGC